MNVKQSFNGVSIIILPAWATGAWNWQNVALHIVRIHYNEFVAAIGTKGNFCNDSQSFETIIKQHPGSSMHEYPTVALAL